MEGAVGTDNRLTNGSQINPRGNCCRENWELGDRIEGSRFFACAVKFTLEVELDHYLRAGEETVHVIHGHGSGALKQAVREHLRRSGYVAQVRAGEQHEGGDAVSVVVVVGVDKAATGP